MIIAVCPVVCEGSMKKGKFQCFIISAISPARLGPDLSALIYCFDYSHSVTCLQQTALKNTQTSFFFFKELKPKTLLVLRFLNLLNFILLIKLYALQSLIKSRCDQRSER